MESSEFYETFVNIPIYYDIKESPYQLDLISEIDNLPF